MILVNFENIYCSFSRLNAIIANSIIIIIFCFFASLSKKYSLFIKLYSGTLPKNKIIRDNDLLV